ncbi:MAG TPA: hypothetical protein VN709_06465 [Terriglobales bacterium]|nr:hypothetical protein [Terriglobales bacterium]
MNCTEFRNLLMSAEPTNPLAAAEHLARCADCQQTQERWTEAIRRVREYRVSPSPGLAQRTRQLVRQRAATLRQRRNALRLLAGVSSVSLLWMLVSFRLSWDFAGFLTALHVTTSRSAAFVGLNAIPVALVVLVAWTLGMWPSATIGGNEEDFYG